MRRHLSIFMLVLLAGAAFAQTTGSGTITGTLTDPSGAVVPGAEVSIRDTDTGIERKTATNEAGIYNAAFLKPGHYEVTVSKTGFAKVVRTDLTLQVGQILTVDFQAPIQSTETTVTVAGASSVVDSEKTDVSQVV